MGLDNLFLPKKEIYIKIFYIVLIFLTVLIAIGIANIQLDNDVTVLLPVNADTEHEREKIRRLNKEFPSDQILFIGVSGHPFTLENIKLLWELCNEIDQLESVKSSLHPFKSTYFKKIGDTFNIVRMKPADYPKDNQELEDFIKNITSNRYLIGSVISYDRNTAGIIVRMNNNLKIGKEIKNKNFFIKFIEFVFGREFGPQPIERSYFVKQILSVINKYDKFFTIYYAGMPVYEAQTKFYMQKDMFVLLIPSIILMIITLYLNTKTKRGTTLPIMVMLLSLTWVMGLIGWIRYKLNIVGILLPPIILTIGSSYTLHYLFAYYTYSKNFTDSRELVIYSTKHIFPTIFMASITTAAGFASFFTASIEAIRMFGLFAVISIFLTVFFTFFILSKILANLKIPYDIKFEQVKNDIFSKFLNMCKNIVLKLKILWISIFILSIILFIIFIPKIRIETNPSNFFKDSDRVKQSLIFLQNNFKGILHYNFTIRSRDNKRNFFKTRDGMLIAKKFQQYLDNNVYIDGYSMIGWTLSPVTLLEDLNYVLYGKYDIPEDESIIKSFFSFLKASNDDGIKSIINNDFSAINFQVRTHTNNPNEKNYMTEQELAKLEIKLSQELKNIAIQDGNVTVELWGDLFLLSRISKYMIKDQILNIVSTIIFVFIATFILFRSVYFSFMSLIPLTFGVIINFVIMGIFQIPLNAATIMIAAISIGVGIDDSLHFILNYRDILKSGYKSDEALLKTLEFTGRPILFTSIALILGFIVFFLSSFRPIVYFGTLIALAMVSCTFSTLFILPSVLSITDKIRLFMHKNKYGPLY